MHADCMAMMTTLLGSRHMRTGVSCHKSSWFLYFFHVTSVLLSCWLVMAAVRLWIGSVFVHKTGAVASFEPPTLMVLMGRRVSHFLFDVGPLLSYRGQKSLGLYEALILLKRAFYEMNQCLLKFVCSQSDTRFRLCVKSKCVYVFCRSGRICERCSACSW